MGPDLGKKEHSLSLEQAKRRYSQVENVSYDLTFELNSTNVYSGKSRIFFNTKTTAGDLRIDFHDGVIKTVMVNQKKVPVDYNKFYLRIPKSHLKSGLNEVAIDFERAYSSNGRGFHKFTDPEDQRIYTYTNLEPYAANQVFPCLDQPDLKATYKMKVTAPKEWEVITSVFPQTIDTKRNFKTWYFPQSAKFSTYIWSLHAGEYHSWTDRSGDVPLRLFARKSLAKNVKPEDWFPVTQQGLKFFNEYFDYKYPYSKYDQVLVPEFNSGAMENVGAVTFTERFVHRGKKSRKNRRDLANVIMHEMAHMWFGNLVTMKWWDDLWLNESFANYMAFLASYEATKFKEAWIDFHGDKAWAYWEDQLPTTHPIEAKVPDTQQAFANFDGITYGKGASSLKQLSFLIGDTNFRDGLRVYFKKFAEQNTRLKDFMAALQSKTPIKLDQWQKQWLQTESVNIVETQLKCSNGKIQNLSFKQSSLPGYSVLRSHKTKVALFQKNSKGISLQKSFTITLDKENNTVEEARGLACPVLVYANYDDYAYIKTYFGRDSLSFLQDSVGSINDNFLRELIWRAIWDMVRDGKFNAVNYATMLKTHLPHEKEPSILRFISRRTIENTLFYLPKNKTEQRKFYLKFAQSIENTLWNKLRAAQAGSELQKSLFTAYVSTAQTYAGLKNLKNILDSKIKLRGLDIDQDKRWDILVKLSESNFKNSKALVKKEAQRDPSDSGKRMLMVAQAVYPNFEDKLNWIQNLKRKDEALSFDKFRAISRNMFPWHQEEIHEKYSEQFFKDLAWIETHREAHFAGEFARLAPMECKVEAKGNIDTFLSNHPNVRPKTSKSLKVIEHESQRCRKVRTLIKTGKMAL